MPHNDSSSNFSTESSPTEFSSDDWQQLTGDFIGCFDEGYYIGMMSGTSLDGLDTVICQFNTPLDKAKNTQLIATHSQPFPPLLREVLLALCQPNGTQSLDKQLEGLAYEQQPKSELDWFGWASREYAIFASSVVAELLQKAQLSEQDIVVIGCHGQTVRHRPQYGMTLQLLDANLLAEYTGISVVSDFRRRDMAVGGQGAPLAPAYHVAQFMDMSDKQTHRVVLNLGGIANITVLPAGQIEQVIGYDTGTANILLDAWYQYHHQNLDNPANHNNSDSLDKADNLNNHDESTNHTLYDKDGQWAKSGQVYQPLLTQLLSHPFFGLPAPKSTGREDFNLTWLIKELKAFAHISPADVQATLAMFSVQSIANAIDEQAKRLNLTTGEVVVCGGGAYNSHLLTLLTQALPQWHVFTSRDFGIEPTWIEATAFAWLAQQTLMGHAGNLPAVTGASKPVVLGQICFA